MRRRRCDADSHEDVEFQYRKRYEVTCDEIIENLAVETRNAFQYRKRYEVTCDVKLKPLPTKSSVFQYRKRYEVTCDFSGRKPLL